MSAYSFFKVLLKIPYKLLYRIKVVGKENEPDTAYIASANHTCYADPFLEALNLKSKVNYIAKSSLQKHKIIAAFFKMTGVIPINREESDIAAIRKSVNVLKEGKTVGIYPQGTRMANDFPKAEDAMGGLGLLASLSGCPVVPIAIVSKHHHPKPFRKTIIVIGKPIYEKDYPVTDSKLSKKDMAEYCFGRTCELYKEAYDEYYGRN